MTRGRKTTRTLEEAKEYLLERVTFEPNTGCWLWIESWDRAGYAQLVFNRKVSKGHRLSYLAFNGDFDKSLYVCHRCDTPCCINPDHLFTGTVKDNVKDMWVKGRSNVQRSGCEKMEKGENRYNSKLKAEDIPRIRQLRREGWSGPKIAKLFGCSSGTISSVYLGKTWKEIKD